MCAQESEAGQGTNSSAQQPCSLKAKRAPQLPSQPQLHTAGDIHTPVVKCPRTNGNAPSGSVWLGMCPWVTTHTPLSLLSPPVAWRSASGPVPLSALPAHLVTFSFRVVGRTTLSCQPVCNLEGWASSLGGHPDTCLTRHLG